MLKAKPLLAIIFWLVAFGGIASYRHSLYLHRLMGYDADDPGPIPGMTMRQALMLGWTQNRQPYNSSSYMLHAPKKEPGKIRIGIFGDSHVAGDEVAKDFDFPTLLQKHFKAAGDRRVEIINFGVPAFGFSQTFLMWKLFTDRYELDRAVFVIGPHYFMRDDTFSFSEDRFDHIHARYILCDGRPELLPPLGDSYRQIGLIYHGLAFVWRYLRYDARMPVPARMLLSFPTASRFNPFYYAPFGDSKRELLSIYRILLAGAAEKMPVILLFDRNFAPYKKELINSADADFTNYGTYPGEIPLLIAPLGHWSAAGNRLRAEEFFAYLTGKKSVELSGITLSPLESAVARKPRPLYEFSDGTLSIEGRPVGRLMVHKIDALQPWSMEPLNLRERRVAALFNAEGTDLNFVPLTALPGPKDEVVLTFKLDGERQEVSLGRTSAPFGVVASLTSAWDRKWKGVSPRTGSPWEIYVTGSGFIDGVLIRAAGKIGDASLRLAGREILHGTPDDDGRIIFKPLDGDFVRIREEAGQDFNPFQLKKKGIIYVGDHVPFLGYSRVSGTLPFDRPLRAPLLK